MELTQEYLKTLFDYKDGFLYYKVKKAIRVKIGDRAGGLNIAQHGGPRYILKIDDKTYYLSRVIFLWHNGYLPEEVDHENRNPLDNRIENLRAATRFQNTRNTKSRTNSTSKYLGVHLFKTTSRYKRKDGVVNTCTNYYWRANVRLNNKPVHIGCFKSQEAAALAYNREAVRNYGEFANLNICTTS